MRARANDVTVPKAEWLQSWDSYRETSAKFAYAAREVERMIAEGQPVAHLAILLPLPMQQDAVFAALRGMHYRPKLRLRPGARAPMSRPNGHLGIPDEEVGKVLYAKTGTLGPVEPPELVGKEASREWSGPGRQHKVQTMQKLMREERVTHDVAPYELSDANVILRQWGVASHSRRFTPHCEIKTDANGNSFKVVDEHGCDRWIVEEVTQAMLDRELDKATKPAKQAKATTDAQQAAT